MFIENKIPTYVATPFPPLNFNQIGNTCPKKAHNEEMYIDSWKKNLAEEKLEKLEVLLVKLNKKQDAKKNFLDDFNNFLKNRKIN